MGTEAPQKGIVLVDHGSRREEANGIVAEMARLVGSLAADRAVAHAHMELARPDLAEAIDQLVARGVRNVVVFPYFLGPGRHVSEDIPRLCEAARQRHPGVGVVLADPLGVHALLADVVLERVREGERASRP